MAFVMKFCLKSTHQSHAGPSIGSLEIQVSRVVHVHLPDESRVKSALVSENETSSIGGEKQQLFKSHIAKLL